MFKNWKKISFVLSIIIVILGLYLIINVRSDSNDNIVADARIINHEIERLNKMIVIEQNYSAFRTKDFNKFNSKYLDFLNKNIVLYITAKAQVVYDMKKMKVEVDSINKKIHILSIPEPLVEVFPNVEIYSMEDGMFNRFSKSDLNLVMEEGKRDIYKEVEKSNIKSLAKKQLISNLQDLYSMAKLYRWQIQDDTPYAKDLIPLND